MTAPSIAAVGTYGTANASSASIAVPSGVVSGSLILAFLYQEPTSGTTFGTVTPPTGFVEFTGSPVTVTLATKVQQLHAYYKYATGADSGTYLFSQSPSSTSLEFIALRISGGPASGAPDINVATRSTASTTSVGVSLTTSAADALLVHARTTWSGGSWTDTGLTQVLANSTHDIGLYSTTQAVAGATGTITGGQASDGSAAALIAIYPPGGAAVTFASAAALLRLIAPTGTSVADFAATSTAASLRVAGARGTSTAGFAATASAASLRIIAARAAQVADVVIASSAATLRLAGSRATSVASFAATAQAAMLRLTAASGRPAIDNLNTSRAAALRLLGATGIGSAGGTIYSAWATSIPAGLTFPGDGTPINLGLTFYTTKTGQYATGARFYVDNAADGSLAAANVVAGLYAVGVGGFPTGSPLTTVTFGALTKASTPGNADGWNAATWAPVALAANTDYCVVGWSAGNLYSGVNHIFDQTPGVDVPAPSGAAGLLLVEDGLVIRNGTFHQSASLAPTDATFNASAYGVDVTLTDGPPADVVATARAATLRIQGAVGLLVADLSTTTRAAMVRLGGATGTLQAGSVYTAQAALVRATASTGTWTVPGIVSATAQAASIRLMPGFFTGDIVTVTDLGAPPFLRIIASTGTLTANNVTIASQAATLRLTGARATATSATVITAQAASMRLIGQAAVLASDVVATSRAATLRLIAPSSATLIRDANNQARAALLRLVASNATSGSGQFATARAATLRLATVALRVDGAQAAGRDITIHAGPTVTGWASGPTAVGWASGPATT